VFDVPKSTARRPGMLARFLGRAVDASPSQEPAAVRAARHADSC